MKLLLLICASMCTALQMTSDKIVTEILCDGDPEVHSVRLEVEKIICRVKLGGNIIPKFCETYKQPDKFMNKICSTQSQKVKLDLDKVLTEALSIYNVTFEKLLTQFTQSKSTRCVFKSSVFFVPMVQLKSFVNYACSENNDCARFAETICSIYDNEFFKQYCEKYKEKKVALSQMCKDKKRIVKELYHTIFLNKHFNVYHKIINHPAILIKMFTDTICQMPEKGEQIYNRICYKYINLNQKEEQMNFLTYSTSTNEFRKGLTAGSDFFDVYCKDAKSAVDFFTIICEKHKKSYDFGFYLYRLIYLEKNFDILTMIKVVNSDFKTGPEPIDANVPTKIITEFFENTCKVRTLRSEFYNQLCQMNNLRNKYLHKLCNLNPTTAAFYRTICWNIKLAVEAVYFAIYMEGKLGLLNIIADPENTVIINIDKLCVANIRSLQLYKGICENNEFLNNRFFKHLCWGHPTPNRFMNKFCRDKKLTKLKIYEAIYKEGLFRILDLLYNVPIKLVTPTTEQQMNPKYMVDSVLEKTCNEKESEELFYNFICAQNGSLSTTPYFLEKCSNYRQPHLFNLAVCEDREWSSYELYKVTYLVKNFNPMITIMDPKIKIRYFVYDSCKALDIDATNEFHDFLCGENSPKTGFSAVCLKYHTLTTFMHFICQYQEKTAQLLYNMAYKEKNFKILNIIMETEGEKLEIPTKPVNEFIEKLCTEGVGVDLFHKYICNVVIKEKSGDYYHSICNKADKTTESFKSTICKNKEQSKNELYNDIYEKENYQLLSNLNHPKFNIDLFVGRMCSDENNFVEVYEIICSYKMISTGFLNKLCVKYKKPEDFIKNLCQNSKTSDAFYQLIFGLMHFELLYFIKDVIKGIWNNRSDVTKGILNKHPNEVDTEINSTFIEGSFHDEMITTNYTSWFHNELINSYYNTTQGEGLKTIPTVPHLPETNQGEGLITTPTVPHLPETNQDTTIDSSSKVDSDKDDTSSISYYHSVVNVLTKLLTKICNEGHFNPKLKNRLCEVTQFFGEVFRHLCNKNTHNDVFYKELCKKDKTMHQDGFEVLGTASEELYKILFEKQHYDILGYLWIADNAESSKHNLNIPKSPRPLIDLYMYKICHNEVIDVDLYKLVCQSGTRKGYILDLCCYKSGNDAKEFFKMICEKQLDVAEEFFYSIAVYKQHMLSIIMSNTIYSKYKNKDLSSTYDAETDMYYMYVEKKKLGEPEESTNFETIKAVVVHRTPDNPYDGIGPIPCKETQCKIRMAIIDKVINKICLHRIDGSPLYFVLCSGQNNKIIRNVFFSKQCNMFHESSGFFSQVCEVSQEAKDNLFKLVYKEHNYDSLNVIQEMIAYENSQENKNATIADSNNVAAVIINEFMDLTCSTVSTNVLKKALHFDRLYTEACKEKVLTYNNYFNKACKSATSPDSLSQYLCKDKQASINELRRVVFEDNKKSIFIIINKGIYENRITAKALNNKWSYSKGNRRHLGKSSNNKASYLKPLVEDVFGRTCVYLLDGFALYFAICDVTTNAKMGNEFYFNKCTHSKDAADFVIKLCDVCEEAKENLIQIIQQEPGNSTEVVVKELQTCDNSRYPVMVKEEARSATLHDSILTNTSYKDSLHRKNVIRKYSKFDLVEVLIQRICAKELNGYALFFVLCGRKTNNITSKYYGKLCVTYRNPESFMRNLCDDCDVAKDNLLSVISKEENFYTYKIIQELISSNKGIRKPYGKTNKRKMYYNSINLYIEFYIETACKKPIERQPITLNLDFFYTESCKNFELIEELFLKRACQSSTDPDRFIQKLCKNEQTTVRQFKDLVFKGSKRMLMKFIRERVDRYKNMGTSINERSLLKKKAKKSHNSIVKRSISQDFDAAKDNFLDVIFKEKVNNYEHTISKRSWKGMKRSKPISVYFTQDKLCKDSDDKTSSYVYNTICFTKPPKSIQYLDAVCRRSRTFYEFIKVICSEENIFAVELDKYIFEEGNHGILIPIVLPKEFAAMNVTAMSKTNNENIIRLTTFMNNVCDGKVNGVPFYNVICKDKKVDNLYLKLKCERTRNSYMFFEEICKDQSQVVRQLYIITHEQKDFEISALVMDGIFTNKKSDISDPWTYINSFVKMMCDDGESVRPFYEKICSKKHIKRHDKYFKNICWVSREADSPAGTFLQHLCIDQKEATEEIYHAVYFIKMFDLLRLAKDHQDKLGSTINPTEVNNNPQEELGLYISRLCEEEKYDSALYDLLCQQKFDKNFYIDHTCKKRVTEKYFFKTVCKQRAKFVNALYDLIYLRKIPGIMNILKSKYSPSCNGGNGKCNSGEIQIKKLFLEICSSVPEISNEETKRNFYNVLEKRFILYDILCDNVKPDDRYIFGAVCSVSDTGYEFLKKLCSRHDQVISNLYKYIYEDMNLEMVLILEDLPPCVDCEKTTLFIDSFVRKVCHDKHYSFEFFNKICKIKNPDNKYFIEVCNKSAYGLLSFYLKMCQDLERASTALYDIIYKEQHFEIINPIKLRFPSRPPSQLVYKPKNNKKTCLMDDYCIPPYINLQNYKIRKGESNYMIGNEKDEKELFEEIFMIPKNWTGNL